MFKHGNTVVYSASRLLLSCLEEQRDCSGLWLVCWWCLGAVGTDICSLSARKWIPHWRASDSGAPPCAQLDWNGTLHYCTKLLFALKRWDKLHGAFVSLTNPKTLRHIFWFHYDQYTIILISGVLVIVLVYCEHYPAFLWTYCKNKTRNKI